MGRDTGDGGAGPLPRRLHTRRREGASGLPALTTGATRPSAPAAFTASCWRCVHCGRGHQRPRQSPRMCSRHACVHLSVLGCPAPSRRLSRALIAAMADVAHGARRPVVEPQRRADRAFDLRVLQRVRGPKETRRLARQDRGGEVAPTCRCGAMGSRTGFPTPAGAGGDTGCRARVWLSGGMTDASLGPSRPHRRPIRRRDFGGRVLVAPASIRPALARPGAWLSEATRLKMERCLQSAGDVRAIQDVSGQAWRRG